jgi:GAF domain-containing protein
MCASAEDVLDSRPEQSLSWATTDEAGGAKAKGLKQGGRKGSVPTKANRRVRRKVVSAATLAEQLAAKTRELDEALRQQAATANILQVIGRSTFNLQSVLDTLVESAALLCEADSATMARSKGDILVYAASYGLSSDLIELLNKARFVRGRGTVTGRALLEGKPVQVEDVQADPEITITEAIKAVHHTVLAVPLLRHDETIGVIALRRHEVRRFSDKQIELASTFADQAVIAIENARLFDEVQARTKQLTEALEQQTATSEVLQVISSSPGELEPVFEAMLSNAVRICEAKFGTLYLREEDGFRTVAMHNAPAAFAEARRLDPLVRPPPSSSISLAAKTKQPAQLADILGEAGYAVRDPFVVSAAELGGFRTVLSVPMLKDNELIGVITIYRQVRLVASKLNSSVISPNRQSSPSRTRGC